MQRFFKIFFPLWGHSPRELRARKALLTLLQLATDHQTITYGGLAKKISVNNPRHVTTLLSPAAEVVENYYGAQAPPVCALVVSAATRIPGDGFIASLDERFLRQPKAQYYALPLNEKKKLIMEMQDTVFAYNWSDLLALAGDFNRYH